MFVSLRVKITTELISMSSEYYSTWKYSKHSCQSYELLKLAVYHKKLKLKWEKKNYFDGHIR